MSEATVNATISITPDTKLMAQEDSKEVFGKVNISAYISALIIAANKKKLVDSLLDEHLPKKK